MARGDAQMHVRVPADVEAYLHREARENASSLNSEVVRAIRTIMKRKGPAEAATSPSHCHQLPRPKDEKMMTNISTGAPAPASIDLSSMSTLSMAEVYALSEGVRLLNEVTVGLLCQPRFKKPGTVSLNDAGSILSAFSVMMDECEAAAVLAAKQAQPKNRICLEYQLWTVVAHNATFGGDLEDLARLVEDASERLAAWQSQEGAQA